MSDRILKALMQLFAIIANTDEVGVGGREIVERFLRRQISSHFVAQYLDVYDQFLDSLKGKTEEGKTRKRTSVNSVKVLRICTEINKELEQKQKIIVLIRLFEFVNIASISVSDQHVEFLNTVAETFSISETDRENCLLLVKGAESFPEEQADDFLIINKLKTSGAPESALRHIQRENISGSIVFLHIHNPQIFVFVYRGTDQVFLDGRAVIPNAVNVFETGSVIRGAKLNPVYYNDVIHNYLGFNIEEEVTYEVQHLGYNFPSGRVALHDLSFTTSSKNMVGVMGNSGAGKTTLLNLLNGSVQPGMGKILINGMDMYANKSKITGLIGNIPQDDLLIEELSVFQNLFYSSKLYFGTLTDEEITAKVDRCLESLMLFEIKDLLVGDPLNKFISGGQRKRLNIALELIREPEILFVDEPTSGLSSNDAENVMDLLKQLSLSGKLIFVVIHQPSSEIFKLFDELLILDKGGYPVYFGNPIDSVRYFKQQMNYVDYENSECSECGNINPEEIFRILEAKTVDEFGRATTERKMRPEEWFRLYNEYFVSGKGDDAGNTEAKEPGKIPRVSTAAKQFLVYFQRNLFSKLNNKQYIGITLAEGPVLAFILALAMRSHEPGKGYEFGTNPNIPVYMFICTIVALFLGLIASAEEIISDKKILKRESFLQLSRNSYLLSKVSYLFLVSAIQSLLFYSVGYFILGFPGLFWHYFLVLFSVSCFGNLLGLNISSGLKTRVAVYILIPFLVIPQIMLSGVMVKFDDLNPLPLLSDRAKVPFIGNIMASRWAYEALATDQYKNNEYEISYFSIHAEKSNVRFRQYWCSKMVEQLDSAKNLIVLGSATADKLNDYDMFFKGEINEAVEEHPQLNLKDISKEKLTAKDTMLIADCRADVDILRKYFNSHGDRIAQQKLDLDQRMLHKFGRIDSFKHIHFNDKLEELVKSQSSDIVADNRIVRKDQPIFIRSRCMSAPFYAYSKTFFGMEMETIWFNTIVIWIMVLCLYVTLYFDWLRKALERKK